MSDWPEGICKSCFDAHTDEAGIQVAKGLATGKMFGYTHWFGQLRLHYHQAGHDWEKASKLVKGTPDEE